MRYFSTLINQFVFGSFMRRSEQICAYFFFVRFVVDCFLFFNFFFSLYFCVFFCWFRNERLSSAIASHRIASLSMYSLDALQNPLNICGEWNIKQAFWCLFMQCSHTFDTIINMNRERVTEKESKRKENQNKKRPATNLFNLIDYRWYV